MKKILIILLSITLSYSSFALDDDVKTPSKDSIESVERARILYNSNNKCIIRLVISGRCLVFLNSNREDEYIIFDESSKQVFTFSVEDYPHIFSYREGPFFLVKKSFFFRTLEIAFRGDGRPYTSNLCSGIKPCWLIGIE